MGNAQQPVGTELGRYPYLPRLLKVFFVTAILLVIGIAIYHIFGFLFFGFLFKYNYYWLFIGLVTFCSYLVLPARKKDKTGLPLYDLAIAFLILGVSLYLSTKGFEMYTEKWHSIPLGVIVALAILEAGRRAVGPFFASICVIAFAYPMFANYMPGLLWGPGFTFGKTVALITSTGQGLLGILLGVGSGILVSFIVFAGVFIGLGAGDFFIRLATALLGRYRGGAAKVAVLASAFFASLSGSSTANVVSTGSFTIPAMKRTGYSPEYAGAIEACASLGGVITPPVMGTLVFIMAEITAIDYTDIMVAASLPAFLYYFSLLAQVDAHAAKIGITGLPKERIPSLKQVLKEGWFFLFVIFFLVWGLAYMRWGIMTPWYAAGLIILLSSFRKETRATAKKFVSCLITIGSMLALVGPILFASAFIYGGLIVTGVSGSFVAGLVATSGGNLAVLLLMGIAAAFLLGMIGMNIPAYIFLAVTFAPAVINIGNLDVLATHLFIVYYSMIAVITPPVASTAFIGATIAGANLMRTAFRAMVLGSVIYFIPLFFLFEPALVLRGNLLSLVYLYPLVLLGLLLLAAGLEGYLWRVGTLAWWSRPLLIIAGALIAFPTTLSWETTVIGAILAAIVIALIRTRKKPMPGKSL